MPSRRRRKSILASWFGRKRREELGSFNARRTVDSRSRKESPRRIRDAIDVIRDSFKRRKSEPIAKESTTLLKVFQEISGIAKQHEQLTHRKRSGRAQTLARKSRRKAGSGILRTLKCMAGGIPALVMTAFVGANVFETTASAERRNVRSENFLIEAMREGRSEEIELMLRKRLVGKASDPISGKLRYLNFLLDSNQIDQARQFTRGIPFDSRERSGELQTLAAVAIDRSGISDENSADEFESRLVIAVADPNTAPRARAMLGRFYRERGQFRASESVLEPIRASESGCLELALLREAQGQFGDIPTTLAPYLIRWRERWLAPKTAADIESSAEALILSNQESVVLETLDTPPVPITQESRDRICTMAAKSLLARELRSGTLRYWKALEELRRHFDRLPCSNIWIDPLIQLSAKDAPTRDKAVELRATIAFEKNCPPAFLNAMALAASKAGEKQFSAMVIASVLTRFPDDPQAREMQAELLITASPPDLKSAAEYLEAVIREHPERGSAFETRGKLHEAKGQFAAALSDYRNASESDPRNPRLHEAIARASRHLGQSDSARIHEQLARELPERP